MQQSFPWQILLDWYKKNGIHSFPWRQYSIENTNQYHVWLAEILLQQTQADRVVPFYTRILEQYPTIHALAQASYEEFFPYYQWLGYYSRARNLLKTATIISEEYAWIFPVDKTALRKLPGIWEYTARAILAFGYGEALLAWDTNLETIFSRYYKGSKTIKLSKDEKSEIEWDFREFIHSFYDFSACEFWESDSENFRKKFQTVWAVASFWNLENWTEIRFQNEVEEIKTFGTFSHKSTEKCILTERNLDEITKNKNITRDINNALMDWARLMEPKNTSLLRPENYIFTKSAFYITRWINEITDKKISTYFPIPDAEIIVILHEDHRQYYSSRRDTYSPFILPPSEEHDTRQYIQAYFRKTYSLELSVRPIHRKWLSIEGVPHIAVNAQIQIGDTSQFVIHQKSHAKVILMNIIP